MARVIFDETGLKLVRSGLAGLVLRRPLVALRWTEVERVWAEGEGRAVRLTFDGARASLTVDSRATKGFERLRTALPARLPRADETWWTALRRAPGAFLVWERP